MCHEAWAAFRAAAAAVSFVKHSPDIPAGNFQVLLFNFVFMFALPHGRCPLTAASQLVIVETSFVLANHFHRPSPCGADSALPK